MSDQIEKQADESSIVIEAPVKKEKKAPVKKEEEAVVPVKKEEEIAPVIEPVKEEEVVVPQVTPGHHSIHPGSYWH